MKTKLLIIFVITISVVSAIIVGFFALSNDQQYSKENPFGFSAQMFYSKEFLPIMCPTQNDCSTHLQLNIWSDVPAILQGYKICNGFSCVIKDNVSFSTKDSAVIPIFDGNKWNAGDKVSIKVQVITQYKDDETHPEPQTFYIDLGESEIVDAWHAEPEMPKTNNAEMESMIELFQNRYHTSQITYTGPKTILNATNVWGETISLVMQPLGDGIDATLTCNHNDWRKQEIITENVLAHLQNKNCFAPALEETMHKNNAEHGPEYDSNKYYPVFDEGSPIQSKKTGEIVLDADNCKRYAYWLTKYQKEKIDLYEDYPRYPPWGNEIFPLVNYCVDVGDLAKTVIDNDILWRFQVNEN